MTFIECKTTKHLARKRLIEGNNPNPVSNLGFFSCVKWSSIIACNCKLSQISQ
jgi:hypothetical protein